MWQSLQNGTTNHK
jgi:hypothetical protein